MPSTPESHLLQKLEQILSQHKHERVCVAGTTCTGKSYLIKHIPYALDMDELVFPTFSPEEYKKVMQKPWTKQVGDTMKRLVNKRVKIEPGKPVFATVVIRESDYIVYLKISDSLLRERVQKRGKQYEDAKNMQDDLLKDILKNDIPYEELDIG